MLHGEPPREGLPLVVAAAGAREVRVFGDFNGWQRPGLELERRPDGTVFEGALPIVEGRMRYRLVIDGRESLDPSNARRDVGPDGHEANVLESGAPQFESLRRDVAMPPSPRL